MDDDRKEQIAGELLEAVEAVLRQHGEFVTQAVVLAATVDSEGERGLWSTTTPTARAWETMGLLHWALAREAVLDED